MRGNAWTLRNRPAARTYDSGVSVVQAVLLAIVGGFVGGVLIPMLSTRQAQRMEETSGLTMSQVLDLIVLASESGIAVVDQFHDVVLFNPRAEELGLVRNRLVDDRAWVAALRVLETGEPVEVDLSTKNPQRGRDRIAVRGTARLLSKEDHNFVVLFADDDSEQVRMEATRRDFVANVSHELKTPVGAMGLLAEALLESADDPDSVRHFGERVLGESVRLGKMVTELIALSRLQGAEKLPDLEAVAVDEVVDEALQRCKISAEAAGIAVTTDHNSGYEVLGDRALLVTALSNLVQNAIAYSPKGSPGLGEPVHPRRQRGDLGDRPRRRHRQGRPGTRLRTFLPRRQGAGPGDRRNGTRPRDRQARGRQPQRIDRPVEQARNGFDVYPADSCTHRDSRDERRGRDGGTVGRRETGMEAKR